MGARHIVRPPGYHRLGADPPSWLDAAGTPVADASELSRLAALAIPPAWTHVWASADPSSDVQATGVDARGRTQYRYSARATERAAAGKFAGMLEFAATLPSVRAIVARHLDADYDADARRPHPERSTAAAVRLLDLGLFRIGNERYERENETFGLTTLRRDHVRLDATRMEFDFVGKEHLRHVVVVEDAPAAAALGELLDQPAEPSGHVFAIADPPLWRRIDSASVNAYLHAHGGGAATAKVFRTWGATVAAAAVAAGATVEDLGGRGGPGVSGRVSRPRDSALLPYAAAAIVLGDTPVVARASYVHPGAIDAGRSREVVLAVHAAAEAAATEDFRAVFHDERVQAAVLAALRSG